MLNVRLKLVARVNFQRSELTNYTAVVKENQVTINANEAVCLYSLGGDQVVFVYKPTQMEDTVKGNEAYLVKSIRLRLTRGKFHPLQIQDYAEAVGLHLEGLRKFDEIIGATQKAAS